MNCEFCQSPVHVWFQCPKKPEGWKPARLAKEKGRVVVHAGSSRTAGSIPADPVKSTATRKDESNSHLPTAAAGKRRFSKLAVSGAKVQSLEPVGLAGTQALPVDANSVRGGLTASVTTSAGTVGNEDRQPFNKKAWMREYMREYMRRKRAK